jgi:L-alanine-DL-glutamate epimerase-like enolase superfamily enzyme
MTMHRVRAVEARAYTVPTDVPEGDGTLAWSSTTAVVVTVDSDGARGVGWTYAPPSCAAVVRDLFADVVADADAMSVSACWQAMVTALRNSSRPGLAGYALSAVDVALWDLKARLLGVPRASVPVYGSGGFTTYSDEQLTRQLRGWAVDEDISRVKIKIGQDHGSSVMRDRDRIRLARDVVGPDAELYVDANGAYGAKQAVRLMRDVADAQVTWFEEPVSSDDLAGLRSVRRAVDADVAAGEYGGDVTYFRRMCAADADDCLQADATRCGGYTEWLRVAAVAAAHHLELSAHCAPHLHAPVAAAIPNLRHVEWFHDHVRVERLIFDGTLDPHGGVLCPNAQRIGHGLAVSDRADEFLVTT